MRRYQRNVLPKAHCVKYALTIKIEALVRRNLHPGAVFVSIKNQIDEICSNCMSNIG